MKGFDFVPRQTGKVELVYSYVLASSTIWITIKKIEYYVEGDKTW